MATFGSRRGQQFFPNKIRLAESRSGALRRRLFLERLEDRTLLAVLASDGFESGDFSGGSGWPDSSWTVAGDAVVQTSNGPQAGSYHARLRSGTGDLQRSVDVTGLSDVRLKFWSKVSSFEGSDQARVQVSPDGTTWTTVQTFTSAQSDNQYRYYDLPVSSAGNTLHVRFDAAMNATNDQWYLDDVQITHAPAPVNGLISWWTADNTTSDSAGPNDATLVGGTTFAAGQVDSAFSFDGVDDRVQVADSESLKLTTSISVEGWVKATGLSTQHGMILFRGDNRGGLDPYWLSVESNGQLVFVVENGTEAAGVSTLMPMNQFVHIAGTLDDATGVMRLYVNGLLMSQTVTTVRPFGELDPAFSPGIGIGNHGGYPNTGHNFPFKGLIDELKIYDRALSSEEVLANFEATKGNLLPAISITDATSLEGDTTIRYLGNLVGAREGGLDDPNMIIYGPDGNLYISSFAGDRVLRYDAATGTPLPAEGKSGAEFVSPGSAGLSRPRSMAFGVDGNLYVASSNSDSILRFDGVTGEPVGDGQFIASGTGGLDAPRGLLFHSDGYLYVTNVGGTEPSIGQDTILRFDAATGAPAGISGDPENAVFIPSGTGGLDNPTQIVFHDGKFYVASTSPSTSNSVLEFTTDGAFVRALVPTGGEGHLSGPTDLVFRDGYLYVTSWANSKVLRFDAQTGAFVDEVVSSDGLARPIGLLFEPSGDFLVASGDSDEIRRYGAEATGVFTVNLSAPFPTAVTVSYSSANGTASAGADYEKVAGQLTFEPGSWKKTISVTTLDDLDVESTESYVVNLSNPTGGIIVRGQGIGTILDNETSPSNTKFYVVDSSADRTFEYGASGNALAGDDWGLTSGNTNPRGAVSNATGSRLWVVDAVGTVFVYDNDGGSLGSWTAGGAGQAEGITTDGVNIWIVDAQDDELLYYAGGALLNSGTHQPTSTYPLAAVNDNPTGIATDGTYIFINDDDKRNQDNIWRYTIAGVFQGGFDLPAFNTKAVGITLDPTGVSDSIWVVDSGTDQVYEYKGIYGSDFNAPLTLIATFNLASGNSNPTDIADPPVGTEAVAADALGSPPQRLGHAVDAALAVEPGEPEGRGVAVAISDDSPRRLERNERWRMQTLLEEWSVPAKRTAIAEAGEFHAPDAALADLLAEEDFWRSLRLP